MRDPRIKFQIDGEPIEIYASITRQPDGRQLRLHFYDFDRGPGQQPLSIDLYMTCTPGSRPTEKRVMDAVKPLLAALLGVLRSDPDMRAVYLETYPPKQTSRQDLVREQSSRERVTKT